jgi:exodeoxyribonuclease I
MYIFYDTETTGLDKNFSQILQIALVFTDDNLNILSSKKVDCRRSPWVIPSPGALLTTGFTPDDLKNSKNSNFEMMQEVDQWVRSQYWPVIFGGYNSLGYDEEVMAQNFHMNLLEPGVTEARNPATGQPNGRMDIMIAVEAVMAYSPGALTLKILSEKGNPSLKLINVASQNGVSLGHDDAHDALNDIKATVGVAKVLKTIAPQVWEQMIELSTQDGVDAFLKKNKVFTHTIYSFGKLKSIVGTNVTRRDGDPNTEVLFDLSIDPAPYLSMSAEQLKKVILDQDRKPPKNPPAGYQPPPRPFYFPRRDAQPILMPLDQSDAVIPAGFDEKVAEARADAIKASAQFQRNLAEASRLARDAKAKPPKPHTQQPEELIDAELSAPTKAKLDLWMKEFRETTSWRDAAALVTDFYKRFEKEVEEEPSIRRYVKFAGRIVFEHAPEELSEQKQKAMKSFIAAHILTPDTDVPWMTIAKARKELEGIEEERAEKKERWAEITDTQIRSLKLYYTALEKEYQPYFKGAANDNAPAPKAFDPSLGPQTPPAPPKAADNGPKL